ncbi:MAG: YgfZ/GcvT domain-containing protein [Planctomycetaceae bacterium]
MSDERWKQALLESGGVFDESNATPAHFGDPSAEYRAGRESAALFDVSDRAQIEVTGEDRAAFLHGFCTNDVKSLQPGGGCEAFFTNIKGRVLAHAFLFAADDSLWIETVAGAEDGLIAHLDRYLITEDVQLRARTAEFGELLVSGPQTLPAVAAAGFASDLDAPNSHCRTDGVRMRRVDWFDTPGVLLSIARGDLPAVWRRLSETQETPPAGATAFHALRIEAEFPLYGMDITEENLAQEVDRNDTAISFTKGCYLGQEPIARIDALGHVNRLLRGLRIAGGAAPSPGAVILGPDDEVEIGRVTSATRLPDGSGAVALACLRSRYAAAGSAVIVETGGERLNGTVFHGSTA